MAEKRTSKRQGAAVNSIKKQVRKAAGGSKSGDQFWVRSDGALCWGNECVIITPNKNGNIDIEINRNRGCDVSTFADAIGNTISKGGETVYRVKND